MTIKRLRTKHPFSSEPTSTLQWAQDLEQLGLTPREVDEEILSWRTPEPPRISMSPRQARVLPFADGKVRKA